MKYVCEAPDDSTWFRIETEVEAERESALMQHAVEKFFRREKEKAERSYTPTSPHYIERDIGLKAHIQRSMPRFLTLRNRDGKGLVTAMLPPEGVDDDDFRIILVGERNTDPYPDYGEAIEALGRHFGLTLDRESCYPYRR